MLLYFISHRLRCICWVALSLNPTYYTAAYGYSLAKNHPFIDGNKRTAFAVMATFLLVNNYLLEVPEAEVVTMMEQLASGEENQESLGKWLAENSVAI